MPMDQQIDKPGSEDLADIEAKRDWVRGHFTERDNSKSGISAELATIIRTSVRDCDEDSLADNPHTPTRR
jgi:hypothetical protein